jgi:hypothetical protein
MSIRVSAGSNFLQEARFLDILFMGDTENVATKAAFFNPYIETSKIRFCLSCCYSSYLYTSSRFVRRPTQIRHVVLQSREQYSHKRGQATYNVGLAYHGKRSAVPPPNSGFTFYGANRWLPPCRSRILKENAPIIASVETLVKEIQNFRSLGSPGSPLYQSSAEKAERSL